MKRRVHVIPTRTFVALVVTSAIASAGLLSTRAADGGVTQWRHLPMAGSDPLPPPPIPASVLRQFTLAYLQWKSLPAMFQPPFPLWLEKHGITDPHIQHIMLQLYLQAEQASSG